MFHALLLDDEPMSLVSLMHSFQWTENGFHPPLTYTNPHEALSVLTDQYFDIAFVDIRMPGLSGFDIIHTCQANHTTTDFIIVSGYSDFKYAHDAILCGALDYCLKPINPEESSQLLASITEKLKKKRIAMDPQRILALTTEEWKLHLTKRGYQPLGFLTIFMADVPFYDAPFTTQYFMDEHTILTIAASEQPITKDQITSYQKDCSFLVYSNLSDASEASFKNLIKQLLLQSETYKKNSFTELHAEEFGTINPAFYHLISYVDENYTSPLSLAALAEDFNLNYTYCSELFKQLTGKSFSKYLNHLRIAKACTLLNNSLLSIEEISNQVGYNDYRYFLQVFKKYKEITPMNYRQRVLKREI